VRLLAILIIAAQGWATPTPTATLTPFYLRVPVDDTGLTIQPLPEIANKVSGEYCYTSDARFAVAKVNYADALTTARLLSKFPAISAANYRSVCFTFVRDSSVDRTRQKVETRPTPTLGVR